MKNDGLIHAVLFNGNGGGRELTWDEINAWTEESGTIWIHLSYMSPETVTWLQDKSDLDPFIVEALLTEETRPRSTVIGEGLLLNLRGVNLNPGADLEDMVSLRAWVEKGRIITTRKRPLLSVSELKKMLLKGRGPVSPSNFIVMINELLTSYIEEAVDKIEDNISTLEEQVFSSHEAVLRSQISAIRRDAIILRRYLAPQREAIVRLQVDSLTWFSTKDERPLHETANSLIRIVEHLDSLRDRASVAQEELTNSLSAQLNSRMYVLSIITAVFLPLSFFTGLLGINVGGIPGATYRWAFLIVILLLILVCIGQFFYFRKKRWI
ncbi:zinc transporter ZntB [Desulforhopalus sp. 52FAK]